jgi:hypothetical protein
VVQALLSCLETGGAQEASPFDTMLSLNFSVFRKTFLPFYSTADDLEIKRVDFQPILLLAPFPS